MPDRASILVTGATGFVGRHLVGHLLSSTRNGITLAVRDKRKCPADWQRNERVRIVETGPLNVSTNLAEALRGTRSVIHLAGLAHVGKRLDPTQFTAANSLATQRLVQSAAVTDVSTFIHLSSIAAISGNSSVHEVDDATRNPPATPYGKSKLEAEVHVAALARQGMLAVSIRPPLVVGFDARGNWGSLQRLAATGLPLPLLGADNRRSLIGIRTLVEALVDLATSPRSSALSGNYCISDEDPLSLSAIIELLRSGMGLRGGMFRFPIGVLRSLANAAGRHQMASGLFGDLRVNSSRFRRVFDFKGSQSISEAIIESGRFFSDSANTEKAS